MRDRRKRRPAQVRLAWVNSPSNPTGRVLARRIACASLSAGHGPVGAVLASDECYIDLAFDTTPISMLHPEVCGQSHDGVLGVYSLSKRSNLAGYRAGFVTGDPSLVAELLEVRKHAGMIVPAPVQAAMTAALPDDAHAQAQHARYARRRTGVRPALEAAGWVVTHSEAGLYLWASYPATGLLGVGRVLAEIGILVSPGAFYGPAGRQAHPRRSDGDRRARQPQAAGEARRTELAGVGEPGPQIGFPRNESPRVGRHLRNESSLLRMSQVGPLCRRAFRLVLIRYLEVR